MKNVKIRDIIVGPMPIKYTFKQSSVSLIIKNEAKDEQIINEGKDEQIINEDTNQNTGN